MSIQSTRSGPEPSSSPVVRTVIGDVDPSEIGFTSMHEHLLLDARVWYRALDERDVGYRDLPVSPATLPDVRRHATSFMDNLLLDDEETAVQELSLYAAAGGDTIADLTTEGLRIDPRSAVRISRRTGVRVVAGCGIYVHATHEAWVCGASVEQLEDRLETEVQEGLGGTGILPGMFGEIGMSAPPELCERRVLQAAARVAARHGMSLTIHVDNGGAFAQQHVEDCARGGLPPDRVICGHLDERLDPAYHEAVLATGAVVAFDTFGSELRFPGLFDHPSDARRTRHLVGLLEWGWSDQLVVGHDVFVKAHLHLHGGNGYDHLPARVVPSLEREYGVDPVTVSKLVVDNPRRLLACTPPGVRRSEAGGTSSAQGAHGRRTL